MYEDEVQERKKKFVVLFYFVFILKMVVVDFGTFFPIWSVSLKKNQQEGFGRHFLG